MATEPVGTRGRRDVCPRKTRQFVIVQCRRHRNVGFFFLFLLPTYEKRRFNNATGNSPSPQKAANAVRYTVCSRPPRIPMHFKSKPRPRAYAKQIHREFASRVLCRFRFALALRRHGELTTRWRGTNGHRQ